MSLLGFPVFCLNTSIALSCYCDILVNSDHSISAEIAGVYNSSGLKGVCIMLFFHDGLVWTVGLTTEIKLCFHFFFGMWDLSEFWFFPAPT